MSKWIINCLVSIFILMLVGCQSLPNSVSSSSLYDDLGGQSGVEKIVDQLIIETSVNPLIAPHFKESNMKRFRTILVEHLCHLSGGNCTYTGDTMVDVHTGMNIKQSEFNALVEDLITAMETVGIATRAQNRLLAILARLRSEIINI